MDVPLSERERWLERLAGDDVTFKPWLARVLSSDACTATGFLRAWPDLGSDAPFEPGAVIGPYRLESRLGEGGMGEVWRASRTDEGPRREVALKLPHRELLGGPFRQRFARERDVLAALSHPHIAQVYDAGLSAEGYPYLALELVDGQPITEACAAGHASLRQRIELVRQVLEALTYAHQRLIVHRDIKPTNVLVTPQAGVKLLDFGIAKLLRPTDALFTGLIPGSARLATPAYAAPEQLADGDITVAADIFSVGVLLFELCTGHRPFAAGPFGQYAREAPLASQRADALAAGITDGGRLARDLRGDIDAIIARALALDPGARYSSAEAFARDLELWRAGLPVAARRIGWATLSLKFVRRNTVGVALAAVLALALIGGAAGIAWQAHRAEREAARANAVKNYLIGIFEQGDPNGGGKPSETMTVKELLDHGADQVDAALAGQPETEMELLDTLSQIYNSLEDSSRATQADTRRLELARALYGADDPRVVNRTIDLAENRSLFLDPAGAQALLQSIREPVFTHYGADSLERARWLETWAESLRTTHGARDEAQAYASQAVAILGAHFPENDAYPYALYVLASYQYDAEEFEASLATQEKYRDALSARGNAAGMERLQYLTLAGNTLRHLGRYDEAEKLLEENQTLAAQLLGRGNSFYLSGLLTKALIANDLGRRDPAMALFAEGLAIVAGDGVAPGWVTAFHTYYGAALAAGGDAASAIPILEDALRQNQLHPTEEFSLRHTQSLLGDAYDQAGRTAEARTLLETVRNDSVRYNTSAGANALGARERWARFLLDHGEAEPARAECNDILAVAAGGASAPAALAQADLARIALGEGDSAGADRLSAQAIQTIDAVKLGYDLRARTDLWLARAEILLATGQKPQAAELAARALAAARGSDAPASPRLARALAVASKSQ